MDQKLNSIERIDDDETKLFEVRKHPIGIILLYIQASVGMIFAAGIAYFLLPLVITDTDMAFFIANIFTASSVLITFLVAVIATIIYRENRLIVTDRNITQVLQFGIFGRKVSQLNINNVEDVTTVSNGILPSLFNYGSLNIETAGEQVNFHFTFCPNVGHNAKVILEARERMLGQSSVPVPQTQATVDETAKSAAEAIKDLGAETIKQATIR